ncbi:MAG: hypothetical protein HQL84_11035 [Magnetococcales bacterium]|nr:hypothetical protein [Magnetococcales bacterium]MBF0150567.1 hypothetical protein [Magnetococcales bacterium]MBF0171818.1 hypothetical protein [Magnetococcales bacterium]MBF0632577.1 hypothetical protein [Magnetococcales bacterium]
MRQNTKELLASWRRQTGIIPIPLSQRESKLPIGALGAALTARPSPQTIASDSNPRQVEKSSRPPQTGQPQKEKPQPAAPALAHHLAAYRTRS